MYQSGHSARKQWTSALDTAEHADRSDVPCGRACAIYLDEFSDSEKVERVVVDHWTQRLIEYVDWSSRCFSLSASLFAFHLQVPITTFISPPPQRDYPAAYNAVETLPVNQSLSEAI